MEQKVLFLSFFFPGYINEMQSLEGLLTWQSFGALHMTCSPSGLLTWNSGPYFSHADLGSSDMVVLKSGLSLWHADLRAFCYGTHGVFFYMTYTVLRGFWHGGSSGFSIWHTVHAGFGHGSPSGLYINEMQSFGAFDMAITCRWRHDMQTFGAFWLLHTWLFWLFSWFVWGFLSVLGMCE